MARQLGMLAAGLAAVAAVASSSAATLPSGALTSRIAFSRGFSPERYEIWTLRGDGRELRRVTRACQWDWFPTWSPSRKQIAFTRACRGSFAVYIVNADGSHLRRLTPKSLDSEWPTWSPDGKRIAFEGTPVIPNPPPNAERGEIYVIGANGRGLRRLTRSHVADSNPAWSPDGRTILFSSRRAPLGNQLMLVSPRGGTARALGLHGGEPAWSPDGKRIAWGRGVKGAPAETDDIWVANADGSNARNLTREKVGVASHHPSWSPDGLRIAFMSSKGPSSLWVVNAAGGGLRQLTRAPFEDADPAWQPAPAR